MSNKKTRPVTNDSNGPPRRRSARLSSPNENLAKTAPSGIAKRSIVVRKIAPRKTIVHSEDNKENEQRLSSGSLLKKQNKSTPEPAQPLPPKATVLSPILPPPSLCLQAPADTKDLVWSQKVRRSYSRLSQGDQSFESPRDGSSPTSGRRETLFGFEKLQTPEVVRKLERSKVGAEVSRSLSGLSSFTLLEGDDSVVPSPELDVNIPGVAIVKEKRRRKRVPQLKLTELEDLAAQMNAEFEEAEGFELVVE